MEDDILVQEGAREPGKVPRGAAMGEAEEVGEGGGWSRHWAALQGLAPRVY